MGTSNQESGERLKELGPPKTDMVLGLKKEQEVRGRAEEETKLGRNPLALMPSMASLCPQDRNAGSTVLLQQGPLEVR